MQHQNDNLLGQKLATTNNDALVLTGSWRIAPTLTTTVSGQSNVVANTSPVDTFAVNTHSIAVTAMTAWQASLFHRTSVLAVAYTLQRTTDFDPFTHLPRMTVHNVSVSDEVSLTSAISLAPSLSLAATQTTGAATQENVYAGFRGQGRFGKLHLSAGTSQAFSAGRRVFGLTSDDNYTLPWQTPPPAAAPLHELHGVRDHARVRRVVRHAVRLAELLTSRARLSCSSAPRP